MLGRRSVVIRHLLVKYGVSSIRRISASSLCHNTIDLIRDSLVSLSLFESSSNFGLTSNFDCGGDRRSEGVAERGGSDGIDALNSSGDVSYFSDCRCSNRDVDGLNSRGGNLGIFFAFNRGILTSGCCYFSFLFKLDCRSICGHEGRKSKGFHVS